MKNIITITALLAATAMNAETITVPDNSRTELTSSDYNTYIVNDGQLFLSTKTTYNSSVVLNGAGYKYDNTTSQALAALRLGGSDSSGVTLAGTVTIGGDTRIWSNSFWNTVSGAITTADSATSGSLTIVGKTGDASDISTYGLILSGGMNLTKGALKFEGVGSSFYFRVSLSEKNKTYTAQSLASYTSGPTSSSVSVNAPTLKIGNGVTFTLSNTATTAGADQTFSGMISGTSGSDYTGTLKIASGVQKFSDVEVYGPTIVVASGATLDIIRTKTYETLSIESGGTLKVSVDDNTVKVNPYDVIYDNYIVFALSTSFAEGSKLALDLTGLTTDGDKVVLPIISSTSLQFGEDDLSDSVVEPELFDVASSNLGKYKNWTREWSVASEYNSDYEVDIYALSLTLTAPVPEPAAFGLLVGAGALALVAARRRRRAK